MTVEKVLSEIRNAAADRRAAEATEVTKLLKRAESGDVSAMYLLAHDLGEGRGTDLDRESEIRWYERAANGGDTRAMHNLACVFDDSQLYEKARAWYLRAADLGDGSSMCNLGYMSEHGHGSPVSHEEAIAWYRRGIDREDAQSRVNLAELLRTQNSEQHAYECAELMRDASEDGCIDGIHGWALYLATGYGVDARKDSAERLMCQLASMGHENATRWLRAHAVNWFDAWPWFPGRSIGPLRLGRAVEPVADKLGLVEDNDEFEEGPLETAFSSVQYGLYVQRTRGCILSVCPSHPSSLRILYHDQDLVGLSVEAAMRLVEAHDWTVGDEEFAWAFRDDCWLSSNALGLTLRVREMAVSLESVSVSADDSLWNDGQPRRSGSST